MKTSMRVYHVPDGKITRLRVTCRCGAQWVEEIPSEIYEAHFIAPIFTCSKCKQEYYLFDKHLRRTEAEPYEQPMREYIYDGQVRQNGNYDA
jgi:hypothetical protein